MLQGWKADCCCLVTSGHVDLWLLSSCGGYGKGGRNLPFWMPLETKVLSGGKRWGCCSSTSLIC